MNHRTTHSDAQVVDGRARSPSPEKFAWRSDQQREQVRRFLRNLLIAHDNLLTARRAWEAVVTSVFKFQPDLTSNLGAMTSNLPSYHQVKTLWKKERQAIASSLLGVPSGPKTRRLPKIACNVMPLSTGAMQRRFRRTESLRKPDLPPSTPL